MKKSTVWCSNGSKTPIGRQVNISGPLLKIQGLKFAKELDISEFKASNGWLESFNCQNIIVLKTMSGERGDVKPEVVSDWLQRLPALLEGYELSNVFNKDETGLFYRDTTRRTYTLKILH